MEQNKQDTKQCTLQLHEVPESEYLTGGERSQNVMMSGMEFDDEGTEKTGPTNILCVLVPKTIEHFQAPPKIPALYIVH